MLSFFLLIRKVTPSVVHGGDVGEDREVWSDGCQYLDEEEDPSEDEDDDYADSHDSGDQ